MPVQTTLMIIADIGGYTAYIRKHKGALIHAHLIINALLEAVISAAGRDFALSKLEGDAAFLYMTVKGNTPEELSHLVDAAVAVHRAFHGKLAVMMPNTLCECPACEGMALLRIKVVAHIGEALFTRIRRMTELAGEDVIRVHRMLKSNVPIPEYILTSPEVTARLPETIRGRAHRITVEMEGFGHTDAFYLDLAELAGEHPHPVVLPWLMRAMAFVLHEVQGAPYKLGWKRPLVGFRNIPSE